MYHPRTEQKIHLPKTNIPLPPKRRHEPKKRKRIIFQLPTSSIFRGRLLLVSGRKKNLGIPSECWILLDEISSQSCGCWDLAGLNKEFHGYIKPREGHVMRIMGNER